MKIKASFPFLTSGIVPRSETRADIYLTTTRSIEVEEVSTRETEIAFEARMPIENNGFVAARDAGRESIVFRMRSYDGKLYRPVETDKVTLLKAFGNGRDDKLPDPGTGISRSSREDPANPLACAIRRQHDWRLEALSGGRSRRLLAWPRGPSAKDREPTRNATDFERVLSSLAELDMDMVEVSTRMVERQESKLLSIGGKLWMASRPPSWRVSVMDEHWREKHVRLELAIATEGFDRMLARRHFPLDRLDEARAYAAACATSNATDRSYTYSRAEYIPDDYSIADHGLVDFDEAGEELARIGYAVTMECMRYKPSLAPTEWHEKVGEHRLGLLEEAFDLTVGTNHVLGEIGNIAPLVTDVLDVWKGLSRPMSYCDVGPAGSRFKNMMVKRAKTLAENAPISVGFALPQQPAHRM